MRLAIAISGVLFAGACAPNLIEYYYMSFVDIPGIKVLEYGKSDAGISLGHKEMPLRYELRRNKYTLLLSMDVQSIGGGGGAVMLKTDHKDLHVRVVSTPKEHSISGSCGVAGFGGQRTLDELKEWKALHLWGRAVAYCGKTELGRRVLFDQMPGVLDYQIINNDGNIVAEERLHFTLVRNGTYIGLHGP